MLGGLSHWTRDASPNVYEDNASYCVFNTLRPIQNGRRFADDTFKRIFLNENIRISIKISLKFVPKGLINNIPALVQIMAWRRAGDKPLSEPMMVCLPTHTCGTRSQWVNKNIVITLWWNLMASDKLWLCSDMHFSNCSWWFKVIDILRIPSDKN